MRRPTLVLADNDPDVLDLLVTDLGLEGYDVVAAVQFGAAAVTACVRHRPDVLVVDYRMPPGQDGLETAEQVHISATVDAIILYTNYRSPELAADARRFGARVVVKGPLQSLREALADATASDRREEAKL